MFMGKYMKDNIYTLGISAYYHDSAACLLKNEIILAASQEERFTRKKHDSSFPSNAIKYCLNEAKINSSDLNYVSFYDRPFLKFDRIIKTYLSYYPHGFKSFLKSMPLWVKKKLWTEKLLRNELDFIKGEYIFPNTICPMLLLLITFLHLRKLLL